MLTSRFKAKSLSIHRAFKRRTDFDSASLDKVALFFHIRKSYRADTRCTCKIFAFNFAADQILSSIYIVCDMLINGFKVKAYKVRYID